jgi:hypothetical protein
MQVWLFFQPGTGGDGIANLFERSNNVTPIDGVTDYWRIHRVVDNDIKFYAPNVDEFGCFRDNQSFKNTNNRLRKEYVDIVNQNSNCIITSHDTTLEWLFASDCLDILLKNQIKLLLTSTRDPWLNAITATTKNLLPTLPTKGMPTSVIYSEKFDYVLDVDLFKTNWDYVKHFCKEVNLDLCKSKYLHYCNLLSCNKTYLKDQFDIEQWESTINKTNITYKLIDTWQPTEVDQ